MKAAVALFIACALAAQTQFALRDNGAGLLELLDADKPALVYNYGMQLKEGVAERYRRCCYIHPLYAPDGTVLTDDFPRDHYHHRGLSWMWPEVFWEDKQYDMWVPKDLRARSIRRTAGGATLEAENGWFLGEEQAVKEIVRITVHPVKGMSREIDLLLSFEALDKPVMIRGITPDKKGYGGLSFRFAPRTETVIRTEHEADTKDSDLKPYPWAEMEALFGGKRAGARVTIDPANPGFPNGWCLRHYGFLGVNYPGLTGHTLEKGKPLVLKYRVTVFAR